MVKAGNMSKGQGGTGVGNIHIGGLSRGSSGSWDHCVDDTCGGCEHEGSNTNMGSVGMGKKGDGEESKGGNNGDKDSKGKGNMGSNDSD